MWLRRGGGIVILLFHNTLCNGVKLSSIMCVNQPISSGDEGRRGESANQMNVFSGVLFGW